MAIIETIGLLFGLFMLYITYISLKKSQLNRNDAIVWGAIWVGVICFAIFSRQIQPAISLIGVVRLFDFVFAAGFAIIFGIIFFLFRKSRVLEKKLEAIMEKIIQKK